MAQAATRTPRALSRQDLSARGAIVMAAVAMLAVTVLDLLDGRLGLLFSVGFVLAAITAPLSVDVRSLFPTGVLPPVLLATTLLLVCVVAPDTIRVDGMDADAGTFARFLAAVIDHGLTLVIGHGLALGIIGLRIVTDPDD